MNKLDLLEIMTGVFQPSHNTRLELLEQVADEILEIISCPSCECDKCNGVSNDDWYDRWSKSRKENGLPKPPPKDEF